MVAASNQVSNWAVIYLDWSGVEWIWNQIQITLGLVSS